MPRVTNPAAARDSWEALLPNSTAASRASLTQCTVHCLSHLTYLVWPSIPIKTAGMLARKFPKVIVNPTPGSCPAAADISIALDEPTIQSVAPFWQIEEEFEVIGIILGTAVQDLRVVPCNVSSTRCHAAS